MEMAKKYKVSQQLIGRLLADDKNILGIKLETLQRIFPDTTIDGKLQTTNNQKVSNSNNNIITQSTNNFLSSSRDDILHEIQDNILIDNDLNDVEKVKFMRFIRNLSTKKG
jgi:hypothetical protein